MKSCSNFPEGNGEPDLFLYMENGPKLFLEVKKEHDRVSSAQLECLAQIRGVLKAEVGIIYVVKHGRQHKPRTFDLDLSAYPPYRPPPLSSSTEAWNSGTFSA